MDFKGLIDQDILNRFDFRQKCLSDFTDSVLQAQLIKTNKELLEIIRSLVIIKLQEGNNA